MKKIVRFSSYALLLGISFSTITPTSIALANQNYDTSQPIEIRSDRTLDANDNNIIDSSRQENLGDKMMEELRVLGHQLSENKYRAREISAAERITNHIELTPSNFRHIPYAKVNGDMVLENGESLAAHQAYLTNNTGIEQRLSTASFDYTQTDSVTTTSSHSFGTSMTTSAAMKFPFVSGTMSMTVKYDYSNTNAVTTSTQKKWSVPSQQITVPAGRSYKVEWLLNVGTASGTTDLTSKVNGIVFYKINAPASLKYGYHVGTAMKEQENMKKLLGEGAAKWNFEKDWEYVDEETATRKWGDSKYSARLGTELIMQITDETTGRSVAVNSIPLDITPEVID